MDEDTAREGKRLITAALQREWKPKLRALIQAISAKNGIPWNDACDSAEYDIVTASEQFKLESHARPDTEDERVGWELCAQAMLTIISEVRAERAHEGTR